MGTGKENGRNCFAAELKRIVGDNIPDDLHDETDFLKPYNALWKKDKPWKGYTVHSPHFDGILPAMELLNVVLVKDGTARLETTDEIVQFVFLFLRCLFGESFVYQACIYSYFTLPGL